LVSGFATDFVSFTEAIYRRMRCRHVRQKESGHNQFEIDKERKKGGEKETWMGRERG
jgi:hypothetical protein